MTGASVPPAAATTRLVRVPADLPGLVELGLALDHATREGDSLVFAADERDLAALAAAGVAVEVVIADLESFYEERLLGERSLWEGKTLDPGFGFGSMGGFYTWDEMVEKLDEMRTDYPDLITVRQSLGPSHEGRDVWMVKISDHADLEEGEPAILHTALTHAREPIGMQLLIYYMFHLLEGYGTDAEATYLVDERELYFVPVLNPDGYVYNQTTNPNGGGLWRKNRRDSGGGVYGVDLNRNYGYLWGHDNQGSSPSPSASNYRGPAPFSEPETSAIRAFHLGRTIWNAFHYHAYGNHEIHPFAYEASAFPPEPDYALYQRYAGDLTAMNGYDFGNFWQTLRYLANGDAIDWSYGEQVEKNKVFAFLPEVGGGGDGFWPQTSRIMPLVEENLGPNLYFAWIAGARVSLLGITAGPIVPRGATSTAVVELENLGLGAAAGDVTLTLATADPNVTIAEPVKAFPEVPVLGSASNAADPLEFFVSQGAPPDHLITFDLTVSQGPVPLVETSFDVTTASATGVAAGPAPRADGLVLAAHPNPMAPMSEFLIGLPAAGPARLVIFDVSGRARRTLVQGMHEAGEQRVGFDGRDDDGSLLTSGVYLARLTGAGGAAEIRLVLLR
jgi:hypothetical protein